MLPAYSAAAAARYRVEVVLAGEEA